MKIVIFSDELAQQGGWHGTQLQAAFAARGVEVVFASLQDCALHLPGDLSQTKPVVHIPNVDALPKAVFVRGVAGGTLQQITQRLTILHALNLLGVQVYNQAKAIERTVDKAMTSFLLHHSNISTPPTWVCESRAHAHAIIQQNQSHQLVIKPLFGSQGNGVRMVDKLPLPMDAFVDGVFYLQRFIKASCDYRVFIVANQVAAAMRRTGETWLHNVAQGAACEVCNDEAVLAIALQAAQMLDIAYCGVDVIRDEHGKLYVLEVNSIPAWRGLQSVTKTNIAQVLVDDLMSKI